MKLIKEWGDLPPAGAIHNVSCRSCNTKYSALTRDADKIFVNKDYWGLTFDCPACHNKNVITADKLQSGWTEEEKAEVRHKKAEKKGNYGGTF